MFPALRSRIVSSSLFLIATLSASFASQDFVIKEIRIVGNRVLRTHELLDVMVSKPSGIYDTVRLAIDKEHILQRYRQEGYYFAEISMRPERPSDDSSHILVIVSVNEGSQAVVGDIVLEGNAALHAADILDAFETRAGEILDPKTLERDIQSILARYERIGYPYAAVGVNDISVTTDSSQRLGIQLSVDEGTKVMINGVRVQGNRETREHVIVREARVAPPELYDEETISKIPQRLNRMNIFSSIREPELFVGNNGGEILISVEEGNTNTFDGVIGYVPGAQGGESGFITGMVNVIMRNLFGTARKLDVRWQRDDRHSQEIGVRYAEPWVCNVPINLSGNFFQRQQDTIYVRRALGLHAELMLSDVFSVGGTLQQENIIPSTTIAAQAVSNNRTVTAGVTLHYDSRDDIVNPASGVRYRTDYLIGSKKIYSSPFTGRAGNTTVQKLSIDVEIFIEPVERQVVAFGVHGRQITSDNIELSDRYRFGGTNTLRGFRENQFLGSRVAWTNTEYRFLLARRTFVYGFFDSGYYFLPADDRLGIPSSQNVTFGYGVGVRVETSLGNIGVSIALGEGDSFSQAKLHFGLINEF